MIKYDIFYFYPDWTYNKKYTKKLVYLNFKKYFHRLK